MPPTEKFWNEVSRLKKDLEDTYRQLEDDVDTVTITNYDGTIDRIHRINHRINQLDPTGTTREQDPSMYDTHDGSHYYGPSVRPPKSYTTTNAITVDQTDYDTDLVEASNRLAKAQRSFDRVQNISRQLLLAHLVTMALLAVGIVGAGLSFLDPGPACAFIIPNAILAVLLVPARVAWNTMALDQADDNRVDAQNTHARKLEAQIRHYEREHQARLDRASQAQLDK